MTITRAYKTELDLNNEQVTACKRHAGAARWAYNWGLKIKQGRYKATGASPSAMAGARPWLEAKARIRTRRSGREGPRAVAAAAIAAARRPGTVRST